METHVFNFDYKKKKDFYFLLASDLHIGDRLFDKVRFKRDFDQALEYNARIYVNGDVLSLITVKDRKRYTADEAKSDRHRIVNDQIDEAYQLLLPYANNIDVLGVGNHETAIYKWSGFEPLDMLIALLNKERNIKKYGVIRHGGYTGFIRQRYRHGQSGTLTYDIWYNHGQGQGGEVTGSMINLQRRYAYVIANLIWLAHTHQMQYDVGDLIRLDTRNKIMVYSRKGISTGAYIKPIEMTNATKNGYRLNYGEERMRRLQEQGGVLIHHHLKAKVVHTTFMVGG